MKFEQIKINEIPKGWDKLKITDLCKLVKSGGTPSRQNKDYWLDGDVPWLKTQELSDWNIYDTEEKINKLGLKESSARVMPVNTISMAMYGATVGQLGILKNEMATNQACCNMVVDEKKADFRFIFYALKNNRTELINLASGAAQQNLNQDIIKNFQILVPPIPEQRAIAKILSDLDERIELNHQMNKTLEAIGQGLFKHWFVDFEFPNEQGKPYKSSGGKMIDSEFGEIPANWEIAPLTDIVDVLGGGTPPTGEFSYWDGHIPFFTPKDVGNAPYVVQTEKNITQIGLNNCNSQLYPQNTVFITARGTIGKISMAGVLMAMNQSCYALVGKNNSSQYFIFQLMKDVVNRLTQQSHGTVFETITTDTFKRTFVINPDQRTQQKFSEVVKSIYEMILSTIQENVELMQIRDSLLQKLMAGGIRVGAETRK